MTSTLFDIHGWDIISEDNFFYFHRTLDISGKESSYHKSDLTNIWDISESEYNEMKFGKHFAKFLPLVGTNKDYAVKLKDGSVICTGYVDYYFFFIDSKGTIIDKREDIGFDNIYSFDVDKNGNIWYTIPTANYIGQFSLLKSIDIFHLGEKYIDENPLTLPEDIKIYGDFAYISDMHNHRIIRLNIETKEWIEYLKFDELTWEYRQFKDKEIVRLESGIHLIDT